MAPETRSELESPKPSRQETASPLQLGSGGRLATQTSTADPLAASPCETIVPLATGAPSTRSPQQSIPKTSSLNTPLHGAARDVAVGSDPPVLTSAPTTGDAAIRIQVQNEGYGQPVSTATAGSTDGQSLWRRAFTEVSSEEQTLLAGIDVAMDTRQVVSDVEDLIEGVMKTHKRKDWKMLLDGEQLVMRYIAMKILRWADRFKQIADMMMQYDSRHLTLPWGGGFVFFCRSGRAFFFLSSCRAWPFPNHSGGCGGGAREWLRPAIEAELQLMLMAVDLFGQAGNIGCDTTWN